MKYFDWNNEKNEKLKTEREVGFEDVLIAIEEKRILDIIEHKNQKKYPDQKMFVVSINNYAYLIPFIENDQKIFLKTIIPSRKATKKYILKIKNK
ncbi:MAG: toxin [Patescibacteria group bacterium]|nr:toxin [Patescibacteria group bacterium]